MSKAGGVSVEELDALGIFAFCPWAQRAAAAGLSTSWRVAIGLQPRPILASMASTGGSAAQSNDAAVCKQKQEDEGTDVTSQLQVPTSVSGSAGSRDEGYWRFLCERLSEEAAIYVPSGSNHGASSGASIVAPPLGIAASWQQLFLELYELCKLLSIQPGSQEVDGVEPSEPSAADIESFRIEVAARFRPGTGLFTALDDDSRVVLPLHQKVQLVRQQLGCSSKEAMALIMQRRHGGSNGGKPNARGQGGDLLDGGIAGASAGDDTVGTGLFQPCVCHQHVNKEAKPFPQTDATLDVGSTEEGATDGERSSSDDIDEGSEKKDKLDGAAEAAATEAEVQDTDARCSILSIHEEKASVLTVTRQSGLREFSFDRAFGEAAQQEDLYEKTARRLVMEFLNGTSASIICYGQTASGKTHTMFGPSQVQEATDRELRGIVPRACSEVLAVLQHWRRRGLEVQLRASYVELFGNEISDLLREGSVVGQGVEGRYGAVRATDRVGHRYVLDGHVHWPVESLAELNELLRLGDEAKRRAATAMNERSTRAHTVFVLSLTVQQQQQHPRMSRFFFADLGGSEKLSKSKADEGTHAPVTVVGGEELSRLSWQEYYAHRQRVQETLNINKGLFSLKRVIEALHQRSRLAHEGVPHHLLPYVPYQDSKLTMLLREALGGTARTVVVVTATLDPKHAVESLQTLRFAETCAQVQKRRTDEEATSTSVAAALAQLEEEISKLQADIAKKERWETRLIRRHDVDTVAGAFGESEGKVDRVEVVPTSVLVGAEAERERLEHLLQRQAELQGIGGGADSFLGKDYRGMKAVATSDGGRGVDFRHRDRFSAKMKAKDFEDEAVLAEALRFLFRKTAGAVAALGETEEAAKRRLRQDQLPEGYLQIARALRTKWEDNTALGAESRPFGKAMLDRCQAWAKADGKGRDAALHVLLDECAIAALPNEA